MSDDAVFVQRLGRLRQRAKEEHLDGVWIAPGPDLRYLCGIQEGPSERLTLLAVPVDADAVLVCPAFEEHRHEPLTGYARLVPWQETDDPMARLEASLRVTPGQRIAVNAGMPAHLLLALVERFPHVRLQSGSHVLASLRRAKDPAERAALAAAHHAADRAFEAWSAMSWIGATEREASWGLRTELVRAGSHDVAFATIAVGENSASPHHAMGDRRIQEGDVVLLDFGGRVDGYHADVTRTLFAGEPPAGFSEVHDVVRQAQQAAIDHVVIGMTTGDLDRVARSLIERAGFGPQFVHRLGHGIGLDVHELPYLVSGSHDRLAAGDAFSVEPGVYLAGRFGVRIEDTVLLTESGPEVLSRSDRRPRSLA